MASNREYLQSIIAQAAKLLSRIDSPLPKDVPEIDFSNALEGVDNELDEWLSAIEEAE